MVDNPALWKGIQPNWTQVYIILLSSISLEVFGLNILSLYEDILMVII